MDAVPSMLEYIVRGAASAVLPMNLLVMFIGLVVGIVGGMLPGITTVTAVALFVPFTFSMPPVKILSHAVESYLFSCYNLEE